MKPSKPTIERIVELQQLIADFASVERVPHLTDKGRPENDVEHSYGLALTCWFLAKHIAPYYKPFEAWFSNPDYYYKPESTQKTGK